MFGVNEDQSEGDDEQLEVVAEVPSPPEAVMHVTPHREKVLDEEDVPPHVLAICGSIHEVGPEGTRSRQSHHLPIDHYRNKIGWDDPAKAMENREGEGQGFLEMPNNLYQKPLQ